MDKKGTYISWFNYLEKKFYNSKYKCEGRLLNMELKYYKNNMENPGDLA